MLIGIVPPHPSLETALMHFMVLSLDACHYYLPASLSPAISLIVKGGTKALSGPEQSSAIPRLCISGTFLGPRQAVSEPESLVLAVLFRPGYLQTSLSIAPSDIVGRDLDLRGFMDTHKVDSLFEALDTATSIPQYLEIFQNFLMSVFQPAPKKNIAETFLQAHQKMFFPLIELAIYFGIGRRQLERRVLEVFGVSLRDVRRLSRWGFCVERLVNECIAHGSLTRIAHDSGYFDQAHMTREFVELAGIAPLALLRKVSGDDPSYWAYRIKGQDYKDLFIPVN